jgi:transposase
MGPGELLAMSGRELTRLEVVQAVSERRMSQGEAARRLRLSVRQVKRLLRRYRREGPRGLISRRRGRPSNRRIPEAEMSHFIALVREHYADFGPTLAAEYLSDEHGFRRSVETLRHWMIEAEIWEAKQARRRRPHPPRERRPRLGELIQIDGSPHRWFEDRGPYCCLIAFIDDATSRVLMARFVPVESTRAYLGCLRDYVLQHGAPAACYSDRHSIFTKHDPQDPIPTQVERAMIELGIEPIRARSPQAKGRVERLFETLQNRLVKALRLAGIADLEAANAFLETYLPKHNERFAHPPRQPGDVHQPWQRDRSALERICALHHERKVTKDVIVSFRNQRYLMLSRGNRIYSRLRGCHVTVCEHLDGSLEFLHRDRPLSYRPAGSTRHSTSPVDEKTLNARVDDILGRRSSTYKPPPDHPWRRGFAPLLPAHGRAGEGQSQVP